MPTPAQAPPEPFSEVFEPAALLRQAGGDRARLIEIVAWFLQTAPRLLRGIRDAVSRGDGSGLKTATHALREAARNVCAPLVEQAALVLEEMGENHDLRGAPVICAALEQGFAELCPSLLAMVRNEK